MERTASSEAVGVAPRGGGRIVAIDVARGIALVAMTVYHFSWDLAFFGYLDASLVNAPPWVLFARAIATSFLFLVGISLVLAHGDRIRWRGFLLRLAQVTAGAAAISLVTYLMDARSYVFFGILHAIALFSVLALPFLRLPWWVTLFAAAGVWIVGNVWSADAFQPDALLWLGLAPVPPVSNDFVPVFPFFAATLAGVAYARLARARDWFERLRKLRMSRPAERPLDFIGRHSLAYYLLHQPVLFALLFAWTFTTGGPDLTDRAVRQWTSECLAVQDEAFCTAYVACVTDEARKRGLLQALAGNRIGEGERAAVASIVSGCASR